MQKLWVIFVYVAIGIKTLDSYIVVMIAITLTFNWTLPNSLFVPCLALKVCFLTKYMAPTTWVLISLAPFVPKSLADYSCPLSIVPKFMATKSSPLVVFKQLNAPFWLKQLSVSFRIIAKAHPRRTEYPVVLENCAIFKKSIALIPFHNYRVTASQ